MIFSIITNNVFYVNKTSFIKLTKKKLRILLIMNSKSLRKKVLKKNLNQNLIIIILIKTLITTLGETRDLGMEHVDAIDFMLKSTFCQLSIDGSLTVHLKEC